MATFQEMKARYENPQDQGFLGRILSSTTRPFRRALESAQYAASPAGGYKPLFKSSTSKDVSAAIGKPTEQVLKSIGSAGSFLIPGGGGKGATVLGRIGQAAGKGALAGSLAGYGLSETGEELKDIGKGALWGGAIGGALQGIGEVPGMIRTRGAKMQQKGLGKLQNVKAQDQAILDANRKYIETLDDQMVTAKEFARMGDDTYLKELQRQIASGKQPSIDDIYEAVRKSLDVSPKEFANMKTSVLDDMASKGFDTSSAASIANNYPDYKFALYGSDKANLLTQYGDDLVNSSSLKAALKKVDTVVGDQAKLTKWLNDNLESIYGKGATVSKIPSQVSVSQNLATKELLDSVAGGADNLLDMSAKVDNQIMKTARNASRDIASGIDDIDLFLNKATNAEKFGKIVNNGAMTENKLLGGFDDQLFGLQRSAAKESSMLGQRAESFTLQNNKYIQALQRKRASAGADLASLQSKLSTQNQFQVRTSGLMPFHTSKIPLGGDVRAPLAGVKASLGGTMQKIPEVSSGLGKILGAGQRVAPALAGLAVGGGRQEDTLEDVASGGSISEKQAMVLMQSIGAQGGYSYQDAIQEAMSLVPNGSESDILSWAKFLMDQNATPEMDTAAIGNVQQAIELLDQYGGRVAGKLGTATGRIGAFFGASGPGVEYRALISDIRTKIIRYIAGTAQTPTEMKNLVDKLPQPTDEPAVARTKLEGLLGELYGGQGLMGEQTGSIESQYSEW